MYVFVYGTLRQGERNHQIIEGAACIAEQAWISGTMYAKGRAYPYVDTETAGYVYGELYDIDPEKLSDLDELEGYHEAGQENLYNRTVKRVMTDTFEVEAIVYEKGAKLEGRTDTCITSGDWCVYQHTEKAPIYYFAYGSCMDDHRFKLHKVDHYFKNVIGRAILNGYTLQYTIAKEDGGRADIVESDGRVEGKLYAIESEAVSYLYKREGVHTGSYRPAIVNVKRTDGTTYRALTFIVVEKEAEKAPPAHYMEEILRGGAEICSKDYFKKLKRHYQMLSN